MVDNDGFRPNVGIILINEKGGVLFARRIGGQDAWQFPQGGIKERELPEEALFRELKEEVGLDRNDVEILGVTKGWLRYKLPARLIRANQTPLCIGQKQKWYLLKLSSDESNIKLQQDGMTAEFDDWSWVTYWYPLTKVVSFKRDVYRRALKELIPVYNRVCASAKTA